MGTPVIEVTTKDGKTRRLMLTGDPVTIGRDAGNSLTYKDKTISRFHCDIRKDGESFCIRDLGSRTGTRVNSESIIEALLQSGDLIHVGPYEIKFVLLPSDLSAQAQMNNETTSVADPKVDLENQTSQDIADLSDMLETPGDPGSTNNLPDPFDIIEDNSEKQTRRAIDLGGDIQDSSSRHSKRYDQSSDDVKGLVKAALSHHASLQAMMDNLPTRALDPSQLSLINARGQVIHAPSTENIKLAVTAGRDSVMFLQILLRLCAQVRATDLHIEPKKNGFHIRVRVDGMMVNVLEMHKEIAQRLLRVVKVLADIDIAQNQLVQDGHFSTDLPDRQVDYRVSFTPAMFGQKLVIRVLDLAIAPSRLKQLGLPAWMASDVGQVIRQDAGMVLMCGPTGSGKTTTLYALLREIDVSLRNVITIEDPVEYQIDGVTQMPINESHGRSFSTLLRSVLRQDPDVILVGEIRDPETAKIAMQASITGHLVLSTVHAQDSIGTVYRLLDLGVEPYLVSSALYMVLAQRLVRCLCPHCKKPAKPSPTEMMQLAKFGVHDIDKIYWHVGCPSCLMTGYNGRCAVFELLRANDDLRDAIVRSSQVQELRKALRSTLFSSLREDGYRLVAEGITPIEEINRVVGIE